MDVKKISIIDYELVLIFMMCFFGVWLVLMVLWFSFLGRGFLRHDVVPSDVVLQSERHPDTVDVAEKYYWSNDFVGPRLELIGDGETDNTEIFQRLLERNDNQAIPFPPGVFVFSGTLI
jgi:hypothetical protein